MKSRHSEESRRNKEESRSSDSLRRSKASLRRSKASLRRSNDPLRRSNDFLHRPKFSPYRATDSLRRSLQFSRFTFNINPINSETPIERNCPMTAKRLTDRYPTLYLPSVDSAHNLCMPEHCMQRVMPRFILAQRGSGSPQSQQLLLPVMPISLRRAPDRDKKEKLLVKVFVRQMGIVYLSGEMFHERLQLREEVKALMEEGLISSSSSSLLSPSSSCSGSCMNLDSASSTAASSLKDQWSGQTVWGRFRNLPVGSDSTSALRELNQQDSNTLIKKRIPLMGRGAAITVKPTHNSPTLFTPGTNLSGIDKSWSWISLLDAMFSITIIKRGRN
ncbi:hypothetical protein DNTS_032948 [Danionella cerebrum]|uniref:Uncharacterized protein n=1 Tax=Danionella cerebrum TaxID=2873325 RepID=A0A553Q2E2_9TELE|nr:hypothetical protein DNTS_032948 [Danionella translucida]